MSAKNDVMNGRCISTRDMYAGSVCVSCLQVDDDEVVNESPLRSLHQFEVWLGVLIALHIRVIVVVIVGVYMAVKEDVLLRTHC